MVVMGASKHYQRGKVEVLDLGDRTAECLATLRSLSERVRTGGKVCGLLVLIERPMGAYTATDMVMSGCDNVAERLGRIELLVHELKQMKAAILARATESTEEE